MASVSVEHITKNAKNKSIFNNFTIHFPANKIIGLIGENNLHASVLLMLIADILKPDEGYVFINNEVVGIKTRRGVSYIVPPDIFYPNMNINDAIRYFQDLYDDFEPQPLKQLCNMYGIDLNTLIKSLSISQLRLVSMVLCLSRQVPLYILDLYILGQDLEHNEDFMKGILGIICNIKSPRTIIINSPSISDYSPILQEITIIREDKRVVSASIDSLNNTNRTISEFYSDAIK